MATQAIGTIASGDAIYRQGFSSQLFYEGIIENPVVQVLLDNGCINVETDLSKNGGGTFTLQNQPRLTGKGNIGDVDMYSTASQTEVAARTMLIDKWSKSITWPMKGTQAQQFAAFQIDQNTKDLLLDTVKGIVGFSLINHLGGNNSSSLTIPTPSDTYSGTDLLQVTGFNAVSAPSYWYKGGNGGTLTTDNGVTTTDLLSLKDFQTAAQVITTQDTTKPTWQFFSDKDYLAVVFISYTGVNQLINEAVTLGQGAQFQQIMQYQAASGKDAPNMMRPFRIMGQPFLFVQVPDSWLPRGVVTSGTSTKANTRRCIIVGKRAIDMAFGRGFDGGKSPVAGANIEVDTTYKPLNKFAYGAASLLWGCKKTTMTAPGNGASTSYDTGTYVITHYSAS